MEFWRKRQRIRKQQLKEPSIKAMCSRNPKVRFLMERQAIPLSTIQRMPLLPKKRILKSKLLVPKSLQDYQGKIFVKFLNDSGVRSLSKIPAGLSRLGEWSQTVSGMMEAAEVLKTTADLNTGREHADLRTLFLLQVTEGYSVEDAGAGIFIVDDRKQYMILEELLKNEKVEYAEFVTGIASDDALPPDFHTQDNLGYYGNDVYGHKVIDAWDYTTGGNVQLACMEYGLQSTHINFPTFAEGQILLNADPGRDHGTAMCGITIATNNLGEMTPWGVAGICHGVSNFIFRAADPETFGTAITALITAGIGAGDISYMGRTTTASITDETWNPRKTYFSGYVVIYNGTTYRSIRGSVGAQPNISAADWAPFSSTANFTYDVTVANYEAMESMVDTGITYINSAGNTFRYMGAATYRDQLAHRPFHENRLDYIRACWVTENRSSNPGSNWDFSYVNGVPSGFLAGISGVTTLGYGNYFDENDPLDKDYWYRYMFSGSSCACAMLAGVAALVQSYYIDVTEGPLVPAGVIDVLTHFGEAPPAGSFWDTSLPDTMSSINSFLVDVSLETPVIGETTLTFKATVTLGSITSADLHFQYKIPSMDQWINTASQEVTSTGTYSQQVTGLSKYTVYEYRAIAVWEDTSFNERSTITIQDSTITKLNGFVIQRKYHEFADWEIIETLEDSQADSYTDTEQNVFSQQVYYRIKRVEGILESPWSEQKTVDLEIYPMILSGEKNSDGIYLTWNHD
jgi:hypothetical protein